MDDKQANDTERNLDLSMATDTVAPGERPSALQEGRDYYLEDGLFVFTATFLQERGYCCESGCRHCPYQNR